MTASVRIDDESFDRLKQLSAEEDRPMTRIVRNALDAYDQQKLAKVAKAAGGRVPDQGPGGKPETSGDSVGPNVTTPQEPGRPRGDCPHPKDRQRKLAWGTLCGVCGGVVK